MRVRVRVRVRVMVRVRVRVRGGREVDRREARVALRAEDARGRARVAEHARLAQHLVRVRGWG